MTIIPQIKVEEMEFVEGIVFKSIAQRNGAICSTGRKNAYRYAFLKGQGGSMKETTWDSVSKKHSCCQSKVSWRHKTACPRLRFND